MDPTLKEKKQFVKDSQQKLIDGVVDKLINEEGGKQFDYYKNSINRVIWCLESDTMNFREAIECKKKAEAKYFDAQDKYEMLFGKFNWHLQDCFDNCRIDKYREGYECYSSCMIDFKNYLYTGSFLNPEPEKNPQ